jgi:hypothetical protein
VACFFIEKLIAWTCCYGSQALCWSFAMELGFGSSLASLHHKTGPRCVQLKDADVRNALPKKVLVDVVRNYENAFWRFHRTREHTPSVYDTTRRIEASQWKSQHSLSLTMHA